MRHVGRDDPYMHLQVNSLRELVEDWDFQEGPFMEFVAPALQLLAGLLHSSEELETQLQVCSRTASQARSAWPFTSAPLAARYSVTVCRRLVQFLINTMTCSSARSF